MKSELQIAASKLICDIYAVKTGENVVITLDYDSNQKIARVIADAAVEAGAHPMILEIPTPNGVGKAADSDLPLAALSGAVTACDVWVELNHQWLLYSTPFENAYKNNKKLRYMCLADFDEELLIRTVGHVDTTKLKPFMQKAAQMHREAKKMRVTTPAGTDVCFEIEPRHVIAVDCGDASQPGVHMLTGQMNIVPRFGSIFGTIVFDGSVTPPFGKILTENIKLTIEAGVIVKVEGGEEAKEYDAWLHHFEDPGMLKMAHIAYGFNPGAILTGNVVEDERVWGATEWGIGYVSSLDAPPDGQDAVSHSDGICLNSSVWLDDVQIMDCGKIVAPELVELDPR